MKATVRTRLAASLIPIAILIAAGPLAAEARALPIDLDSLPSAPMFGAESAQRGGAVFTVGPNANCDYSNLQTAINTVPEWSRLELMTAYAGTSTPYSITDKSLSIEGGYTGCGTDRQRLSRSSLNAQGSGLVMQILNSGGADEPSRRVDLANLEITGGGGTGFDTSGGLLINSPPGALQVNLVDTRIHHNQRAGFGNGGAGLRVFVNGELPPSQVGGVRQPLLSLSGPLTRIDNNQAEGPGGGILCQGPGNTGNIGILQMFTGTLEFNSASSGGGLASLGCRNVLLANAGPLLGFGSSAGGIRFNTATESGGGIFVDSGGQVVTISSTYQGSTTRYGALLIGNVAVSGGAARALGEGSELFLFDTWVLDNSATFGGALNAGAGGAVIVDRFINSGSCGETAVDAEGRTFYPPCSVIQGNVADFGGVLNSAGESRTRLARTRIRFNQAAIIQGASVIRVGNADAYTGLPTQVELISSVVHDNEGSSPILLGNTSLVNVVHSTISDNPAFAPFRFEAQAGRTALLSVSASVVQGPSGAVLVSRLGEGVMSATAECLIASRAADLSGFDSTSLYLETDPRFRDRQSRDYRLADDSPAIDFCYAVRLPEEISPDIDGRARGQVWTGGPPTVPNPGSGPFDLGAYELAAPNRLFRDRFQPL